MIFTKHSAFFFGTFSKRTNAVDDDEALKNEAENGKELHFTLLYTVANG